MKDVLLSKYFYNLVFRGYRYVVTCGTMQSNAITLSQHVPSTLRTGIIVIVRTISTVVISHIKFYYEMACDYVMRGKDGLLSDVPSPCAE